MCDGTAVRPVNGHPGQPDPGQPAGGFGWLAGTWRRTL
ncbi:MAG: hypothetical protein QOG96_1721, partial [Pseudonocardiales bacterium]|nr:hypothetical protein [Pseudonocardiales bacterium]